MRFLHAMIRVKDIEDSLRFYRDFLDLNLTYTVDLNDCRLYYLSDEDGQTQIELTANFKTPHEGYDNGNCFGHFAFGIDSFEEFSAKMKEFGYEYTYEPYYMPEIDAYIAFLKDPDGNDIEIIK